MNKTKAIYHPKLGEVVLTKKLRSKAIRISITPKRGIRVSLPWHISFSKAINFMESKMDWISEVLIRQKAIITSAENSGKVLKLPESESELKQLKATAKKELAQKTEHLASRFGFEYNRLSVRNNTSRWGSCSTTKNISLNLRLIMLPSHLQDFIILHELCHLVHPNHGKDFHALLDRICGGREKDLNSELRSWRLG